MGLEYGQDQCLMSDVWYESLGIRVELCWKMCAAANAFL